MDSELLLRPDVPVSSVLDGLRDLITRAGNIASSSGLGHLVTEHLMWVEDAELQLRNSFASPAVWQALYTDRYWQFRGFLGGRDIRSRPLITNEVKWQLDRLQGIRNRLERDQQHFAVPADSGVVVPDSNVFIHYKFYDDIRWPKLTGSKRVRLVVPHLVIDELDSLSFRSNVDSDRARTVIKSFRLLRGDAHPEVAVPLPKNPNVELQFMMDPPGHQRRSSNDDEILARAEYLGAFVGKERVHVVTGDYGMQLGAAGRELRCIGADQLTPRSARS